MAKLLSYIDEARCLKVDQFSERPDKTELFDRRFSESPWTKLYLRSVTKPLCVSQKQVSECLEQQYTEDTTTELEDWKCAFLGRSWVPFPIRRTDTVTIREELLCPYREVWKCTTLCLPWISSVPGSTQELSRCFYVTSVRLVWTDGMALMTDFTCMEGRQIYVCKRAFYSQHEWSLKRDKEQSNIYLPSYRTTDHPLHWSHDVTAPFTVTCSALPSWSQQVLCWVQNYRTFRITSKSRRNCY